jgi:hypothetical protein
MFALGSLKPVLAMSGLSFKADIVDMTGLGG